MLRGKERAIIKDMPKSLEYGVWYNLVTPFDWQYFKIKKGSRYISVYDFISDRSPAFKVERKRFREKVLIWVKAPPSPVSGEEY